MAHPASIGILALGEKTGASFNLIPLGGGKNTVAGAVTGEVDFSVLTSGTVISAGDAVKTVLVFGTNRVGEALDNAPEINDAFGMDLPEMLSARAFGIHKKAADDYPDRYETLLNTSRPPSTIRPCWRPISRPSGTPEYLSYGGVEECADFKPRCWNSARATSRCSPAPERRRRGPGGGPAAGPSPDDRTRQGTHDAHDDRADGRT